MSELMTAGSYEAMIIAPTLAAWPLAWRAARSSRRLAHAAIAVGVSIAGLGLALRVRPEMLVVFGDRPFLLWTHASYLAWGALAVLGGCAPLLARRMLGKAVLAFCAVSSLVLCTYPMRLGRELDRLHGATSGNTSVCQQSSPWSCGPAAATAMLARLGVHTTEAEMARRCGTIPGRGTTEYGLWCGLRASLARDEFDVEVVRSGRQTVDRIPLPALLSIRNPLGSGHTVALLKVGKRMAVLADPALPNLSYMPRGEFERQWRGAAIVVQKKGPDRPRDVATHYRPGSSGATNADRPVIALPPA